jgi:hypothetical protein
MIFGMADSHTFQAVDTGHPDPSTLKIQFATRPGQKGITGNLGNGAGSALIDLAANQVLHFERRSTDTPATISADYEPVLFGEQRHWLPKTVKGELTDKSDTFVFVATYTNCRKFEATVKISPLP